MPAIRGNITSRLGELGIVLPEPPVPLGNYVEASDAGYLLYLSGILPVVNHDSLTIGRLGENFSVEDGQKAARIASLNALAAAKQHLGTLDRIKKLVKLTVVMRTTAEFAEHAAVADGASNLFAEIFGQKPGHTRLVYGVQSLPVRAPLIVDAIFEIEPMQVLIKQ
jgi:enamine deaminase RidA (YjgF/YER057c/UK114 family)